LRFKLSWQKRFIPLISSAFTLLGMLYVTMKNRLATCFGRFGDLTRPFSDFKGLPAPSAPPVARGEEA